MPISRKEFELGNFKQRAVKGEVNYVLGFLRKNDKAYRAEDIAKGVSRCRSTVTSILRKLIKRRLVKAKVPYYIAVNRTSKKKGSKKKKK